MATKVTCRVTRQGDPRGIFCGMGVCHDCVMLVDGVPLRTCMTPVRDGMRGVVADRDGTAYFPFLGFGAAVLGKSGTAETSAGRPDGWFVAGAPFAQGVAQSKDRSWAACGG